MDWKKLRDTTDSAKVNKLSFGAEVLFYRLMMKADSHGIFHASPVLIKSFCFPLKETVRTSDIKSWLDELTQVTSKDATPLIRMYTAEGKPFLQIENFGQKKWKSKFPEPPLDVDIDREVDIDVDEDEDSPPAPNYSISILKNLKGVEELATTFKADERWIETACMKISVDKEKMYLLVDEFKKHLESIKDTQKTQTDFAKHFFNWVQKRNLIVVKGKSSSGGFPDYYDAAFEKKLTDGKELSKYWQHLHSKGLKPKKNSFGDTIDWTKS